MLRARLALITALATVCAACSGPGADDQDSSGPAVAPAGAARADIRSEYESLAELARTLDDYQFRLISRCMADQGFTYHVPAGQSPELFQRTYGFTADEVAQGYPVEDEELPPDPNNVVANGLDPQVRERYDLALFGPESARESETLADGSGEISAPGEGCIADSTRVMFGSSSGGSATMSMSTNLPSTALHASELDSTMTELNKRWSDCMEDRGHRDLETPDEAFGEGSGMPSGSERAKQIARDDVGCQTSLDYAKTRRGMEDRYLTGLMDAKEPEVLGAREALASATTKAKKALASR